MENKTPFVIQPETFKDERGVLYAYNDFNLQELNIIRTFSIEVESFRGWHGHQQENNWFKVTSGMLKILLVKPDDWVSPSFNLSPQEYILKAEDHGILFIPAGYVSAIKSLKDNSSLQVFSDKKVEESVKDDYRFDSDRWYYDSFM
ncbi:dTDP-4-dehydrorhamnose 3,5-epimerase family protein [Mesohalobacter halotolerans]|uniref:dTDP-6-deoxy-3,4-keto-hexulose isomerase n=1 Tax=Mesohalobacter halotolerans TaxID=1883405 RepID=A0A4U5TS79_9FLAO|nr:dTDP-4-dehydrorhamnose 3,5-epimerase family protein [Mesohalobacter halotolerans]TKS56976.1 dTDP-6-deoxy-3,4-keto-hexulose isomerase [Mesohalobacter halotolerans]